MRILYLHINDGTNMTRWQSYHIFDEMQRHDCSIIVFDIYKYRNIEEANNKLLKYIKQYKVDLFMTAVNEEILFLETLEKIKMYGVPTLLICFDNLLIPFFHENIANKFDAVWLTSKETEYIFKAWGCNTIFQPYAANPQFLVPDYDIEKERIVFVGTPHGSRIDRINSLIDARIPLTVHTDIINFSKNIISAPLNSYVESFIDGIRYPIGRRLLIASVIDKLTKRDLHIESKYLLMEKSISFEDMAKINCNYALVLSFTDAKSTGIFSNPIPIVNLRHFEIAMSGGLQFTTYSDELSDYFEEDKEIILCKSNEEYIEKAKFYLCYNMKNQRMKMKLAARKRAENDHTWFNRFSKVFKFIGLNKIT